MTALKASVAVLDRSAVRTKPVPISHGLPALVRWKARDYHTMLEAGILNAEARTELVESQVTEISPIGALHLGFQVHLLNWMYDHLDRLTLQPVGQSSLTLDDENEPQPDIYVVRKRGDGYLTALPTAEEAALVVEVADSSLDYDLGDKCLRYARFGISEYWVVDCHGREIHYFNGPDAAGFRRHLVLAEAETLPSRLCGDLRVGDLLPAAVANLGAGEGEGSSCAA